MGRLRLGCEAGAQRIPAGALTMMDAADLLVRVEKLSPAKNEIIVLRVNGCPPPNVVVTLAESLRAHGIEALLMVLEDDSDLYVADEAAMAKMGWVRSCR